MLFKLKIGAKKSKLAFNVNNFYKKMKTNNVFFKNLKLKELMYILFIFICLIDFTFTTLSNPNPPPTDIIPDKCKKKCDTPFNTILGINRNVIAYSNCNEFCANFDDDGAIIKAGNLPNLTQDVYTGMRWQCVEYSRRWLVINHGVTFGSIASAYMIWDLVKVSDVYTNKDYEFYNFANSQTQTPPIVSDLIIYRKSEPNPDGHVGVIVNINLEKGYVDIAEQNYSSKMWKNKTYARRIVLLKKENGNYEILDKDYEEGRFKYHTTTDDDKNEILGWKRIGKSLDNDL